jgi:sulfoquinovose isomerase
MKKTALPMASWLLSSSHRAWLGAEGLRLLAFAKASRVEEGFAALDAQGCLPANARAELIHTTRMTHCFALAHLQGIPGYAPWIDHGIAALQQGSLRDARHGGWFSEAGRGGDKSAYLHAFVALAASSASAAGRPAARALLAEAMGVIEQHFWSEEEGALRENLSHDWVREEAYRGANSNMHATEAFLALADVTADTRWLQRALRIVERVIHGHALAGKYVVHLEAALTRAGLVAPGWLLEDARGLFARACADAWQADGVPGLVYNLDWQGRPVERARLHWVQAEAIAAAAALLRRTGDVLYEQWYRCFWEFAASHFIDVQGGSWHHELDPENRPAGRIWPGKPDLYHAYQALLLPLAPLAPSLATALAEG